MRALRALFVAVGVPGAVAAMLEPPAPREVSTRSTGPVVVQLIWGLVGTAVGAGLALGLSRPNRPRRRTHRDLGGDIEADLDESVDAGSSTRTG